MNDRTRALVALGLLLGAGAAAAQGVCSGNGARILGTDVLTQTVRGQTMCASRGAERWQELHRFGGDLIDFKKGPNDPVDPSTRVGSWSVVPGAGGAALLRHDYGGGQVYDFAVCRAGEVFALVPIGGGSRITGIRLVSGGNGC